MKLSDFTSSVLRNFSGINSNLVINAGNNALIKGSNINVDGNANINTTGDLSIVSATDSYYKFEESSKKGSFGRRSSSSSTKSSTTNVESNINVAGDINSNSQKNINIIASNLSSATGDINLVAKDQINILSGQDFSETIVTSKKRGLTTMANSLKLNQSTTQVSSDIKATNGSLSIASGNNININTQDDINILIEEMDLQKFDNIKKESIIDIHNTLNVL